jgi:tetraacyldisaccharide 4'-kinase
MYLKKPNFWDEKLSLLSFILFPLTYLTKINNFLRDRKKKLLSDKLKTICVGNIYIGGTGKTPTTIKIYDLIKKFRAVATAKKYYSNQKDEEILLKKKTKFLTASNRSTIVKLAIKKKIDVVIFDDGLQDNQLDYNLKIVCFDAQTAIGNSLLIPAGPLRENLEKLKKYDAVLIKCNGQSPYSLIKLIRKYSSQIKIFTSSYKVMNLNEINKHDRYSIFSAIGNPKNFEKTLKKNKFKIIDRSIFPDHHAFSDKDIKYIINKAKKYNTNILTTEKDYVKIPNKYRKHIKYLKIKLVIHDEPKFIKFLKHRIK